MDHARVSLGQGWRRGRGSRAANRRPTLGPARRRPSLSNSPSLALPLASCSSPKSPPVSSASSPLESRRAPRSCPPRGPLLLVRDSELPTLGRSLRAPASLPSVLVSLSAACRRLRAEERQPGYASLSARPPAPQRLTCADRLHISALDTAHCSRHAQWQTNRRAGGGPLRGDGDAGEPQGDVRRGPLWLASAPLTTLPKVQKCAELYSRCHAGGPLACRGPTWLDVSSFDSLLCLLRARFRFEWPSPRFHS